MLKREYKLRIEGGQEYIHYSREGLIINIPIKQNMSEEDIQDRIDETILVRYADRYSKSGFMYDVYCDKVLVRQDYPTESPNNKALIDRLMQDEFFKTFFNQESDSLGSAGEYSNYREPYSNKGISVYKCNKPSESLQLQFGASYLDSNLKPWYGLKFDLTTKEVTLKVVFSEYDGDLPELPKGVRFFSRFHNQDGTARNEIDVFVYATPYRIWDFCNAKGLSYPLPEDEHLKSEVIELWGFVFNKDTLEYGPVKAYSAYHEPN